MCRRPDQHLPALRRQGQILIPRDTFRHAPLAVIHDHARAAGKPKPLPICGAEMRGDARFQNLASCFGQNAHLHRAGELGCIHRDQHIGRAIRPFRLNARDQLIRVAFNQAGTDASFSREALIQRAIRIVMARRIKIDRAFLRRDQGGARQRGGKGQGKQGTAAHEGNLSAREVLSRLAGIKTAQPTV